MRGDDGDRDGCTVLSLVVARAVHRARYVQPFRHRSLRPSPTMSSPIPVSSRATHSTLSKTDAQFLRRVSSGCCSSIFAPSSQNVLSSLTTHSTPFSTWRVSSTSAHSSSSSTYSSGTSTGLASADPCSTSELTGPFEPNAPTTSSTTTTAPFVSSGKRLSSSWTNTPFLLRFWLQNDEGSPSSESPYSKAQRRRIFSFLSKDLHRQPRNDVASRMIAPSSASSLSSSPTTSLMSSSSSLARPRRPRRPRRRCQAWISFIVVVIVAFFLASILDSADATSVEASCQAACKKMVSSPVSTYAFGTLVKVMGRYGNH